MGTWEHRAILEGNKGTRTPPPPGRPSELNAEQNAHTNTLLVVFCGISCSKLFDQRACFDLFSAANTAGDTTEVYLELLTDISIFS